MAHRNEHSLQVISKDVLANSAEKGLIFFSYNLIRWHNHLNPQINKSNWTLIILIKNNF